MFNPAPSRRPYAGAARRTIASAAVDALEPRTLLAAFGVTHAADDANPGSLRWAIQAANESPDADVIYISINGPSTPVSIKPLTALPALTGPTTLYRSFPSAVTIDGANAPADTDGLVLSGSGIQVSDITVQNFRNGIVSSGSGNVVQYTRFGPNRAAGVVALPGGSLRLGNNNTFLNLGTPAIDVNGDGPTPNDADDADNAPNFPVLTAARPLTNRHAAVDGTFHGPANTYVQIDLYTNTPDVYGRRGATFTGLTDERGDLAFGTVFNGVAADAGRQIYATATYDARTSEFSAPVTIAGTTPDTVVTSAFDAGPGSFRQAILNANARPGKDAIYFDYTPNQFPSSGIFILSPLPDVTDPLAIHGTTDRQYGPIQIVGPGDNRYSNNPTYYGTFDGLHLRAGDTTIDNLVVTGFRHGIVIDGPGGNDIGFGGARVRLESNTRDGIRILGDGTGNRIEPTVTFVKNGGLPIDLGGDGPTPNDPLDPDDGANRLQNHPVVASATRLGPNLTVTGSLDAAPGLYRVAVYLRPAAENTSWFSPPNPPTSTLLGVLAVTVDATGHGTFAGTFAAGDATRDFVVTATATAHATGDTSEMSAPDPVGYHAFTVTSNADAGPGTLRQVLLDATAAGNFATVAFDLPGSGVHRITLDSALPTINGTILIDGSTQHGFTAAPLVELVGQTNFAGITIDERAKGVEVRSLTIGGFDRGINVDVLEYDPNTPSGSVAIYGCYVGLTAAGAPLPNTTGVYAASGNFQLGGLAAGQGNVISGNTAAGAEINGWGSTTIVGNLIGTDPTGTRAVPNDIGIRFGGEGALTIGGTVAAARNVVSGNTTAGLSIGNGSGSTVIRGNYVGTAADGETALPNGIGIDVPHADFVDIGGSVAQARNVVSGNRSTGIRIDTYVLGTVLGNSIGVSASGKPLGNGGDGIRATERVTIGGINPGEGNVIAHNGGAGIAVDDFIDYRNTHPYLQVRGNSIYANAGLPLDLNADGPTPNDPTDADVGPSGLQNYPVLTSATTDATSTTITGSIASTSNRTLLLDFYAGFGGQPATYLGAAQITTAADGSATFSVTFAIPLGLDQTITATATDRLSTTNTAYANTSEFSAPVAVEDAAPPVVLSSTYNPALRQLTFLFSKNVTGLTIDAFRLLSRTPGVDVDSNQGVTLTYDPLTRTAAFTLPDNLPFADYRATLSAAAVRDAAGHPMASDATLDLLHLPGDINRDRIVNFDDLLILAKNYNQSGMTYTQGDLTGDGLVNFDDLLVLAKNYNQALPAPVTPAPAITLAAPTPAALTASPTTKKKPTPIFSTQPVAKTKKVTPPKPARHK